MSAQGWAPVPAQLKGRRRDIFFFSMVFLNVAAGATAAPANLGVEADADLLIMGGSAAWSTNAAPQTLLDPSRIPFNVALRASSAGRDIVNTAGPVSNFFGTGQFPCSWPVPKLLPANSNLTVTVSSFDAAADILRLTFFGVKFFFGETEPQ